MTTPAFTNRLAKEKSPYLLQHQHNPVDWYPWGEEAFAKARRENKPIFLSIGYSTCHWCHVMAHESFENPEIAKLMNELFVNIKVDREERPDVDRVYMTYVQATTGGGGWPMSVFLTPELKPFFGGTYFPPEDRYGRPGFPTVLQQLAEAWKKDREKRRRRRRTARSTRSRNTPPPARRRPAPPAREAHRRRLQPAHAELRRRTRRLRRRAEVSAPRRAEFPLPHRTRAKARDSRDGKAALGMALLTLRKMAEGGMHDHLGGGFHRYSVDKFWHVPHFEKMLYDQAQLAPLVSRCLPDHARRRATRRPRATFSITSAAT